MAGALAFGADPGWGEGGFPRAAAAADLFGDRRVEAGTLEVHHGANSTRA